MTIEVKAYPKLNFIEEQSYFSTANALNLAIKAIDLEFGVGFAKENPKLVSSFLIASSNNFIALSSLSDLVHAERIQDSKE